MEPAYETDSEATAWYGRRVPVESDEVRRRLRAACERLLTEYAEWGGHRFHGWTDFPDTSNYFGPVVWSEADCVLRFCLELEKEFPRKVHCELSIDKATRDDWERQREPVPEGKRPRRQAVDIVVSDLDGFLADSTAQAVFRHRQHEAFIEVKWLKRGWRGHTFEYDARKRVKQVEEDLQKLAWNLEVGRCATAAMLIFDDEDYFEEHSTATTWPAGVERLVVGPAALKRRGLADLAP
jgi:hypothetical protein